MAERYHPPYSLEFGNKQIDIPCCYTEFGDCPYCSIPLPTGEIYLDPECGLCSGNGFVENVRLEGQYPVGATSVRPLPKAA